MAADKEQTQADRDSQQAWLYASNCLLYEADDGPDVNVGSDTHPEMVTHAEAVRILYAKFVLVELEADLGRLQATARSAHKLAAEAQKTNTEYAQEEARAADLCERAAQMVIDYGAVDQ